ncbi:MAG: SIS domain-containing protein, partial [Schwartzia sp.]|nr:SIS domain-containing protein [Schwartzia sp. (in: firmicutes)]
MKDTTKTALDTLLKRYPALAACRAEIFAAAETVCDMYRAGGKLIVCGNGGSAADAEHIVGELMKGFLKKRPL